jgi:hypothetical protein
MGLTHRTPAWRERASLRPWTSMTRSSISASSRRSRSVPPTSWATSSVSAAASAVGSARSALSTAIVRWKSVDNSHSRSAAANAGRRLSGADRPASNTACGTDRPNDDVRMRISSMIRGQASCAALRRRRRRTRYEASGAVPRHAPSTSAGSAPPNTARPATTPTATSAAVTPTSSRGSTSPSPAWAIHSATRRRRPSVRAAAGATPSPRQLSTTAV